ncbi:MAG: hypothetical protein B6U65_03665 [Candidatus Wolframiiraptor sp. EX4484-121]|nr:MAG: hypothetical protein B6U65_03665 [Candidatus Wolframiiraptor sp. EX4484-121]
MRKKLDDKEIWERVKDIIVKRKLIPEKLYAIPLPELGYLVFRTVDPNYLKALNKYLAYVLKKHGIKIVIRRSSRYALIPEDLIKRLEAKEREKQESELIVIP